MKIRWLLLSVLMGGSSIAQKTEWTAGFSSGLYKYSGPSAAKSSFIIHPVFVESYTNNPYGNKNGWCYGLLGGVSRINKKNWIIGAELAFEILRSKADITSIGLDFINIPATGSTSLESNTINGYSFGGYRFPIKSMSIDITGGFDFCYLIGTIEKGNATDTDGRNYSTSVDRTTIHFDIRPRIQLDWKYRQIGCYLGYAFGTSNHRKGYLGGVNETYGRLIRFGLKWKWTCK